MNALQLEKGPEEERDYEFDFRRFSELRVDPLASVSITQSPAGGITIGSPIISGTIATVRISGGVSGTTYRLTFLGTTTAGRKIEGWADLSVGVPA